MKIGSWNKMPMWARFLAILLGIPLLAALLRVGFEHWSPGVPAKIFTSIALMAVYLFLRCKPTIQRDSVPMTKEEKKREFNKLQGVIFEFLAVIMLAGAVMGFYGAIVPGGPWPVRIGCGIIGVAGLILGLVFFTLSRRGFVRLKQPANQQPPPDGSNRRDAV